MILTTERCAETNFQERRPKKEGLSVFSDCIQETAVMGLFDFFKKQEKVKESMANAAIALHNSAVLLLDQGLYEPAESKFKQSLTIYEEYFDVNCPAVVKGLENLARLYERTGQYVQAETHYKRALAIKEKGLGPDHKDVVEDLNNLAFLYLSQGQFAQAESNFKRALSILEKNLGPDHSSVGVSLNNLAYLYDIQGGHEHASPLYKRSLAIWEKATGLDHPDVAPSLNKVARLLYFSQGQYAQAEVLYIRALEISEINHGVEHPNLVPSLANLAELYKKTGRDKAAEAIEEHITAIQQNQRSEHGSSKRTLSPSDSCQWARSHLDVTADTEDGHLESMMRTLQELAEEEGCILDIDEVKKMYLRRRTLMRPPTD